MTNKPRTCPECGLVYVPTRSNQEYCSARCQKAATRRAKHERDRVDMEMAAIRAKRKDTNIFGIAPLDQLSEDQLLHYGRTSREAQLRSGKKEEKQ